MAIEIRLGAHVTNPKIVADTIINVFNDSGMTPKIQLVLAMICVNMLRLDNIKLSQDVASLLIMKVIKSKL